MAKHTGLRHITINSTTMLVSALALLASASTSAWAGDEALIQELHRASLEGVDAMIAEATRIQVEFGMEESDAYRELLVVRRDIEANLDDIHQYSNWRDRLSRDLANQHAEAAEHFMTVAGYAVHQQIRLGRREMAEYCNNTIEPLHEPLTVRLAAALQLPEEERAIALPPVDADLQTLRDRQAVYLSGILGNVEQIGARYESHRELAARSLWRMRNTYERLGNEDEVTRLRRALVEETGLPGRSYLTQPYLAFNQAYIGTHDCRWHWGVTTHAYYVMPSTAYVASAFEYQPYETFNDEDAYLPPPDRFANSRLGVLAEILAHRKIQYFRLSAVSDELTPQIIETNRRLNAINQDLQRVQELREPALDLVDREIARLAPFMTDVATADGAVDAAENALFEADNRLALEERAFEQAQADYRPGYYRVGPDGSVMRVEGEPRSDDRSRSDWMTALRRSIGEWQNQIDEKNDEIGRLLDSPAARQNPSAIMTAIRERQAQIADLQRAKQGDENRLAELSAINDAPPEEPQSLRQARIDVTRARSALEHAQAGRDETRQALARSNAFDEANRNYRATMVHLKGRVTEIRGYSEDTAAWAERYGNDFETLFTPSPDIDYRVSVEVLLDDLERALTDSQESVRTQLEDLVYEQREVDGRLREVTQIYLRTAQLAAVMIDEAMPDRGDANQAAVLTFMQEYRQALGTVEGYVTAPNSMLERAQSGLNFSADAMETLGINESETSATLRNGALNSISKYMEIGSAISAVNGRLDEANTILSFVDGLSNAPGANDAERAFNQLDRTLAAANLAFSQVPIMGEFAGQYIEFMQSSAASIYSDARAIRQARIDEWLRTLGTAPERHLYTAEELRRAGLLDLDNSRRFGGSSADDILIAMQIRRIVAILGATNINEACNRTAQRFNQTYRAGRVSCAEQGRI